MDERLVGVIHLAPLPGSPRASCDLESVAERAAAEACLLAEAGFDGAIVENFGDVPFTADRVEPITVAAMTRCALAVRAAAPALSLGINVLRNDAEAALSVAAASEATMIRINVHTGARLTDQGIVAGRAHDTLRRRRAWALDHVRLLCDVAVKHAAPLAPRPIEEEAEETAARGLADALLVTGSGTGRAASHEELARVIGASALPVLVASGTTAEGLARLFELCSGLHGVIVGSALRAGGRAGAPLDRARTLRFGEAFRDLGLCAPGRG